MIAEIYIRAEAAVFNNNVQRIRRGDPGAANIAIKQGWFVLEGAGATRRYLHPDQVIYFIFLNEV